MCCVLHNIKTHKRPIKGRGTAQRGAGRWGGRGGGGGGGGGGEGGGGAFGGWDKRAL